MNLAPRLDFEPPTFWLTSRSEIIALLALARQSDLPFRAVRVMNVFTKGMVGHNMQPEAKFLRLRTPVELGSRFGDWRVCWLGDGQPCQAEDFYL